MRFVVAGTAVLLSGSSLAAPEQLPGVGRIFGYVPDEATAIRIAITVWEPIYGKKEIESERPFMATLVKGIWYVMDDGSHIVVGGSAQASIRQRDGKVLHISHAF